MQILKKIASFSTITFSSRILGLVRDWLLARYFGADATMDAFLVAFKIPNFFRRIFAEGAFSQVFVPQLVHLKKDSDKNLYQEFVGAIFARLFSIVLIFTLLGILFSPLYVYLFAPGFSGNEQQIELTNQLLKWTFPYLFFVSLMAFITALLNSVGRFSLGAFMPVLLNISLILAIVFLTGFFNLPIYAVAIGVFIGGFIQLLTLFVWALKLNLMVKPSFSLSQKNREKIKLFWRKIFPALLTVSVIQINLLIDMVLASTLPSGSISWLYFGQRLMELPNGVFVVALSTVILPTLSAQLSHNFKQKFQQSIDKALLLGLYMTLPAVIGLCFFAIPIVSLLFENGEFTLLDSQMAGSALLFYALALPAFMMVKVCSSVFFAYQNTKTPLLVSIIAVSVNIIFSLLLLESMKHNGLALATSIATWTNAGLLYGLLLKQHKIKIIQMQKEFVKILIVSFVFALMIGFLSYFFNNQWYDWGKSTQLIYLLTTIVTAIILYLLLSFLVKINFKEWFNWQVDLKSN